MAHRAVVITHNDLARLTKLRDGINEFVSRLISEVPVRKPPVKAKPRKGKPTGAAAHKKYLAKSPPAIVAEAGPPAA